MNIMFSQSILARARQCMRLKYSTVKVVMGTRGCQTLSLTGQRTLEPVNSKASDFTARYIELHKDMLLQDSLKMELRIGIDFPAYSLSLVL